MQNFMMNLKNRMMAVNDRMDAVVKNHSILEHETKKKIEDNQNKMII